MKTKEHIPKKKFKILYLIILLIISQINSYAQLASLTSVASAGITKTTATGFSFITDEGGSAVTDRGMCWSTNNPPTILDNITSDGAGIGGFISDLTGLTPNTTYYIRSYATNGSGTAYGNVITIHTLSDSPELTTTAITGITNTGCASGGTVSSPGTYSAVLSEGVCWNRSGSPTLKNMDGNTSDGAITPFTSNPSGLMPSTVYYLCAYAINGTDTAYGNVLSFTTLGTPPLLSTNAITGITSSGCTSGGNITAWGGSNITDRGVCWGTSTGPLSSGSHTSDGTGTGSYTSNPASLTPNTLYYLRSFAVNSTSTAYGNELTFTTKNTPPTGLNVTSLSYDGFIANWTAPAGIGSEPYTYTIRVYNNSGCTGAPIRTFSGISSSLTSYQITYLKFNTSYWYVMRTINAGGESDSITSSTTTLAANLYKGGSEDGFEIGNYYTPLSFCFIPLFTDAYYGGTGDGSVINNKIIKNCPYSYYGGSEDGYIESDYTTPTTLCQPIDFNSVYLGGSDDGFVNKNSIVIKCPYFYYGGNEDGYLESDYSITNCPVPNFTSAYYGGSEDGFIDNNLTLKRCPYNYYGGSEDGIDVFSVGQINCPPPVFTNVYFGGNEDGFIDNNLTLKRCPYNYYGGSEDGLAVFSVKPACLPTVDFNTALNCADQTVTYTTNCTGIPTCPPSKYSPTYSWTFNGGNPSSYTGATPPTVTYTTTGTFTTTLYAGNDSVGYSSMTKDIQIANNSLTPGLTADGPTTFCDGDSVHLTASPGGAGISYLWSAPSGKTSQTITATTSGTYTVTISNSCTSATESQIVTVNFNPVPVITTSPFVNDSVTLTCSVADSYIWSNDTNANIATTQSIKVGYANPNHYKLRYNVIVTNPGGCQNTTYADVIIEPGCLASVPLRRPLCSFDAKPYQNKWVEVDWRSPYDFYVDYFTVERSRDQKNFEEVGIMIVDSNKTPTQSFTLFDKEPYMGISWYRIKNTNKDKSYGYSEAKQVYLNARDVVLAGIKPNPATTYLEYYLVSDYESLPVTIEIKDILGQVVLTKNINIYKGDNHYQLKLTGIESGLYFSTITIKLHNNGLESKKTITDKFVKISM